MELFDKIKKGLFLLSLCFICLGQMVAQNVLFVKSDVTNGEIITVDGVTGAAYTTPQAAISASAVGDTIRFTEDYTGTSNVSITNRVLDGQGHTLTGESGNNIHTRGATIMNLYIRNTSVSGKGIYMDGTMSGDVIIDNCDIDDVTYCIHRDGAITNPSYSLIIKNSSLKCWISWSDAFKSVIITNCTFGKGTSGYAHLRPYGSAVVENCSFSSDFSVSTTNGPIADNAIIFNNCDIAGTPLTSDNLNSLLENHNQEASDQKGVVANGSFSQDSNGEITGGIFGGNPESLNSLCAEGYAAVPLGTSPQTYQVSPVYYIHFNNNGGTGTMEDSYVDQANPIFTVPASTFTNGDWVFDTWNTKADGTGDSYAPDATMTISSDTTLYAQWRGVAKNMNTGISYTNLQAAVDAVTAGDTIRMLANVNLTAAVTITKTLTLDLNGDTISGTATDVIVVDGGDLTIKDGGENGLIRNTNAESDDAIWLTQNGNLTLNSGNIYGVKYGVYASSGVMTINGGSITSDLLTIVIRTATLNANGGRLVNTKTNPDDNGALVYIVEESAANINIAGTEMVGTSSAATYGIWEYQANSIIRMTAGSITTPEFCLLNNGSFTTSTSKWFIEGGTLTSTASTAIYHPAPDTIVIGKDDCTGPVINGLNAAIETRAGHLIIKGGTLTATATPYDIASNNNGSTTVGAAVAVAQHTTAVATTVDIICGTLVGEAAAISITNPEGNTADNVSASITGGTFLGEVISTDDRMEDYITGGTFDDESVTEALQQNLAPGYALFDTVITVGSDEINSSVVRPAYFFYYDKNHVTAIGTMDTVVKRRDATEAERKITVLDCAFTCLPDSAFDRWNTQADGLGTDVAVGAELVLTSDVTLYAIWKEGFTIHYHNNGGTGTIASQSKSPGETVTLSNGVGFTLYRWNTAADESGTNYALGAEYSADANLDLYAVWRKNLNMTMNSTDVVCYGENNGTDTVKIIGGDPTYMIVLSSTVLAQNDTVRTSETQYVFTNLKPGDYNVELSDTLKKDFITGTFTISQPDTLVISSITVPDRPCPLMGTGTYEVSMTTTGGNGGNVITWGGDVTDADALSSSITPDADDRDRTYTVTVTVTDSKNCSATQTATFSVAPVIANDGTTHSNTTMTVAPISQSILYGCDTVIRNFGTPEFVFTNPAITEDILDTVYNNVATAFPDSIFTVGENTIIWTAVDTCGHTVTAEQTITITHKPCPTVTDYDENSYPAVRIGCDCWTTKNLVSTHYSYPDDHSEIPDVRAYPINTRASVYGNLYTYEAAMHGETVTGTTPVQGACPEGWHVPSQAEAEALMSSSEVRDLMSQGTWIPDNGTNASGFNILPGGFYNAELDRYERMYVSAYFWIAVPATAVYHACEFGAACSSLELIPGSLENGFSIRCVLTKPTE